MVVDVVLEIGVNKEIVKKLYELAQETRALLYGEFTLASGLKSAYYFDGKMLTLDPEGAHLIGKSILEELKDVQIDAVGGLEIGAIPIATAVALLSGGGQRPIPAFIVRKEAKKHGTKKTIEGHFHKGMRVAIVDDVITKGGSVIEAIRAVEAEGGKVEKVIVVVDRHQGGSDILRKEGYNFTALIDLSATGEAVVAETSGTKR